jgi:hypothetical protein
MFSVSSSPGKLGSGSSGLHLIQARSRSMVSRFRSMILGSPHSMPIVCSSGGTCKVFVLSPRCISIRLTIPSNLFNIERDKVQVVRIVEEEIKGVKVLHYKESRSLYSNTNHYVRERSKHHVSRYRTLPHVNLSCVLFLTWKVPEMYP